jgi:hypothetical protein
MQTTLQRYQFSLLELFCIVTVAGVVLGYCWCQCLKPAIESGIFDHQQTYRELQIERGQKELERRNHAKP